MVAPGWQGRGLGTALQARLQEYAAARGVRGFIAEILPSNARMIRLVASAPGGQTTTQDEDAIQVTIVFGEPGPAEATNEPKPAKAEIKEPSEGKRPKRAAKKQRKK
jgi:GNAT superfamily N-acetyltransferase